MPSAKNDDSLEQTLRENLDFRRQLMAEVAKAEEPVPLASKISKWWRFGRPEDQPFILALLIVLIAITLYFVL
jgi:hypothetical protein